VKNLKREYRMSNEERLGVRDYGLGIKKDTPVPHNPYLLLTI